MSCLCYIIRLSMWCRLGEAYSRKILFSLVGAVVIVAGCGSSESSSSGTSSSSSVLNIEDTDSEDIEDTDAENADAENADPLVLPTGESVISPRASAETTTTISPNSTTTVAISNTSIAEAVIGDSQLCNLTRNISQSEVNIIVENAELLNSAFPNLSNEQIDDRLSQAQLVVFAFLTCEVEVTEVLSLLSDDYLNTEVENLMIAVTSSNRSDFINSYSSSFCLRIAFDIYEWTIESPYRLRHIVAALRYAWLLVNLDSEQELAIGVAVQQMEENLWSDLTGVSSDDPESAGGEAGGEADEELALALSDLRDICGYQPVPS